MFRQGVRVAAGFLALAFAALCVDAQDVTGSWNGTMSGTRKCASGGFVAFSGSATAGLLQTGSSFIGTVTSTALFPDEAKCQPGSSATVVMLLSGTVSGNAVSGTAVVPLLGTFLMGGAVGGDAMTLVLADEIAAVSISLSRAGSGGAPAGLTGSYNGNYSFRETVRNCSNLTVKTYSGAMTASLVQTGNDLAGRLGITGAKQTDRDGSICSLRDDVGVVPIVISARVDGNAISGLFIVDEEAPAAFTGTVNGNTITGKATWPEEDAQLDFTITRTGTTLLPVVLAFAAEPDGVTPGQQVTLRWQTLNASGVTIDNGVGAGPASGTATVTPSVTTTYTLVASGSGATAIARALVTVSSGTPANVIVSSLPRGIVQAAGQAGATDSYTLTNIGGSSTDITLTQVGTFFSQSPSTFKLAAGASQVVTITAIAQQAGLFTGSSNPSGNGVAAGTNVQLRMLVATTPNGTVKPRANTSRFVAQSTGQQPGGGQLSVKNEGTATLQAILVADVPWIVHDTQPVTIAAGQTGTVSFSVDPKKRPDADALLGAATGSLSLRFLSGASSTGSGPVTHDTAGSGSLNITIVSVVRPGSTSGSPTAIAPGELAYFIPGLSSKNGAIGDLILASRGGASPLTDFRMFYTASFAGTFYQVSSLPQLPGNGSVAFPSAVTSVFGNLSQTGTVQLRSVENNKVAAAGVRVNAGSGGTFAGALPLLRSDRGIGAGERIILTGVQKASGVQTDLYIQEVSGSQASAQIEFLSASGAVVGSAPTVNLGAFGFSESIDVVPSNAVAVRLTNLGTNPGRLGAAASVVTTAGDSWVIDDPTAGASAIDTFYVPLLRTSSDSQTTLSVTNRTNDSQAFSVDIVSPSSRRHSVRSSSTREGPVVQETQSYTLAAFATQQVTTTSPGYARIRGVAGAVVVAARNVVSPGASGPFGSAIPAVPASAALAAGEGQRFGAVDDAAAATRLASSPGSYRSSLVLLETAGSGATVRVTLAFQYPASTKTTGVATASREFVLAPSQYLVISDLAGSVIGEGRQAFGELRGMIADVDVLDGAGRVIPFVFSIDNGSGDMNVRRN